MTSIRQEETAFNERLAREAKKKADEESEKRQLQQRLQTKLSNAEKHEREHSSQRAASLMDRAERYKQKQLQVKVSAEEEQKLRETKKQKLLNSIERSVQSKARFDEAIISQVKQRNEEQLARVHRRLASLVSAEEAEDRRRDQLLRAIESHSEFRLPSRFIQTTQLGARANSTGQS